MSTIKKSCLAALVIFVAATVCYTAYVSSAMLIHGILTFRPELIFRSLVKLAIIFGVPTFICWIVWSLSGKPFSDI